MKYVTLAAAALFATLNSAHAQDAALGLWKTEVDDGSYAYVDMYMCDDLICGKIVRTFNSEGEYPGKNIGKDIVRGMKSDGGGKYKGQVWRPSNDKIYTGKLSLAGDALTMKGCIAGGLLCARQEWTRIK